MIKLKDILKEEIEYYIDTTKDDLTRIVAKDDNTLYHGIRGLKGETNFLKFVLVPAKYYAIFNYYLKNKKSKKITKQELQREVDKLNTLSYIDFNKLYKK